MEITKSTIIVGGDFNSGHIDWPIPAVIPGKPDIKKIETLINLINDYSLIQIVDNQHQVIEHSTSYL